MLQVGCQHGPGGAADPGLSFEETRSHFGAWAIVSSPLTLSHDVTNDTVTAQIWDIISNTEVLAVNQAYVGDSGGKYDESDSQQLEFTDAFIEQSNGAEKPVLAPAWQLLYKPVGSGKVAVLAMNSESDTRNLTVDFASVPGLSCFLFCTSADTKPRHTVPLLLRMIVSFCLFPRFATLLPRCAVQLVCGAGYMEPSRPRHLQRQYFRAGGQPRCCVFYCRLIKVSTVTSDHHAAWMHVVCTYIHAYACISSQSSGPDLFPTETIACSL